MRETAADHSRLSKLLSLILRHRPDEFGLNMDDYGFVPMADLAEAVQERYKEVTEDDIRAVVDESRQRRFEITEQGMRALYGHSFFVEMDGEPIDPPEKLYMGSTAVAARIMKAEGARPIDRFYLHLSLTREVAESRSHQVGTPCVVEVLANKAGEEEGIEFYARGEVVLSKEIPASCIGDISGLEQADSGTEDRADRGYRPGRQSRRGGQSGGGRHSSNRTDSSSRSRPADPERSSSSSDSPSESDRPPSSDRPENDSPTTFGRKPRRNTGYGRR